MKSWGSAPDLLRSEGSAARGATETPPRGQRECGRTEDAHLPAWPLPTELLAPLPLATSEVRAASRIWRASPRRLSVSVTEKNPKGKARF